MFAATHNISLNPYPIRSYSVPKESAIISFWHEDHDHPYQPSAQPVAYILWYLLYVSLNSHLHLYLGREHDRA